MEISSIENTELLKKIRDYRNYILKITSDDVSIHPWILNVDNRRYEYLTLIPFISDKIIPFELLKQSYKGESNYFVLIGNLISKIDSKDYDIQKLRIECLADIQNCFDLNQFSVIYKNFFENNLSVEMIDVITILTFLFENGFGNDFDNEYYKHNSKIIEAIANKLRKDKQLVR